MGLPPPPSSLPPGEEGTVSVVIPSWNSRQDLVSCLPSLLRQTLPPQSIHVVDNGSGDGTVDWLASEHPTVDVLAWPENRGFAAACNAGIARATGRFILVLNADTTLAPDCLGQLLAGAARHPNASLSPKILRGDGVHIDSTGLLLRRRRFSPMDRGEGEHDAGQYDAECEIFGPTGAAALFPRALLKDVAPEGEVYDEAFFAYYEDVDLAWRLQSLGSGSWCIPAAVVQHARRGPGTVGGPLFARGYANRYLYYLKNATRLDLLLDLPFMIPVEFVRLLRLRLRSKQAFDFVPHLRASLPRARRQRRELAARRRVSVRGLRRF